MRLLPKYEVHSCLIAKKKLIFMVAPTLILNKYKNRPNGMIFFKNNRNSVTFTQVHHSSSSCHVPPWSSPLNSIVLFNTPNTCELYYLGVMEIVYGNWIHASNIVHKDQHSHPQRKSLKKSPPPPQRRYQSKSRNLFFTSIFQIQLRNCDIREFWLKSLTSESTKLPNNAESSMPYNVKHV